MIKTKRDYCIAHNLCSRCGRPNDRLPMVSCARCAERRKLLKVKIGGSKKIEISAEEAEELSLRIKIDKILDTVSSKEPEGGNPGFFRRWGHDTDCGDAEAIIDKAMEILRE